MKKFASADLRNVSFAGQGSSGKTSLVEAMLFLTGKTEKLGKVDAGTSVMDYEPEEVKRHISISTAINYCVWKKKKINVLDTPGDPNFAFEALSSLRVADGIILVIDALDGVKIQSEKLWDYARQRKIPGMIFISKMDRDRADFDMALKDVQDTLGVKPVCFTIPIGAEADFRGVVDIIEQKALIYAGDDSGKFEVSEIPADLKEKVNEYHEKLVEDAAGADEELLEKYLDEGTINKAEVMRGLRRGIMTGELAPVFVGSGTKNMGVQPLLDAIVQLMPSPLEAGPFTGRDPEGRKIERAPDPEGPFSALVFKTIADPYAGRLNVMRVYSGTLNPDTNVLNSTKGVKERVGQLLQLEGKGQEAMSSAVSGELLAVAKLKETMTGDTLCSEKDPIIYEPLEPPQPMISYSITPKAKGDEEKVMSSLQKLIEEDPTLSLRREEQTKEFIISGMGQIHIQVTKEKLERKFGVNVDLAAPKVPYKETIKKKARAQGRYKKQTGGRGQFGDTWLEVEPLPRGAGFEFVDKIVGGVIPKQYIPAVEKGVQEAMAKGVLAGYPMIDIKVTLYDGKYHEVDSSDLAFKIAASLGFKKACQQAGVVLLEPIMNMEIIVPDEYIGDVIGDINSRRGRIIGTESHGNYQVVKTQVPMAEVLEYAPDLTRITSGRGDFTMSFSHYEEVPPQIAERIIAQAKKEGEEEE